MGPHKSTNHVGTVRKHIRRSSVRIGSFGSRKNNNGGIIMSASSLKYAFIAMLVALFAGFLPASPVAAAPATPPKPTITYQVIEDEVVGTAEGSVSVAAPQSDGPQIAAAKPLGFKYQGVSMGSGDQRLVLWDVTTTATDTLKVTLTPQDGSPIVKDMPVEARDYPGHVVERNVAPQGKSVHWKIEYQGQIVAEFDLMVLKAPVHLAFTFASETNCEGSGTYLKDPGVVAFLDGAADPFYAQWLYAHEGSFGPFTFVTGQHTLVIKAFGKQNGSDDWHNWSELHGQLTVNFVSTCDQPQPVEELTISGTCPTPGVDSADLSLTGVFSRDGMPVANESVTISLPDGNSTSVNTNDKGEYSYTFQNAKQFVGKDITASAGAASKALTITAEMFVKCVSAPVEGITLSAICPTPGADSVDLSVSGAYIVNGQPVAGAEVSLALPNGQNATVTTNDKGEFSYTFQNAKQFVGKNITASAGAASKALTITAEMFVKCVSQPNPVNGVQITATCPTPGKESKDLAVAGAAFVDNQPVAGAVVTLKLGSKELAQVTTAQDGTFAFMFRNAKAEIGKTLSATFNDSSDSLVISADLFTTCVKRGNGKVEPQFSSYVQCAQLPADGNGNAPKDWVRNLVFDGLKGAESETIISATVTADYITYAQFGRGTKVIGIDPRAIRLNQQIAATWKVSYVNSTSGEFKVRVFDRGFDTFDPNNQDTWKNYAIVDELGRFVVWGGSKENRAEYIRVLEYNKWICEKPTTVEQPKPHTICTGLDAAGNPIIATYYDGEAVPAAGDCTPQPKPQPRTICAGLDKDGNKIFVPAENDSELDSPGCTAGDLVEETTQIVAPQTNTSGAALAMFGYLAVLALILANAAKQLGLI